MSSKPIKNTHPSYRVPLFSPEKDGPGAPGGQSWTVQWLKFDNSYFKDIKAKMDEDLLVLPTDVVLFKDPSFKDYTEAHAKLSNLGAKFDPPEGIVLDDSPIQAAPEKFVAADYSTGKVVTSNTLSGESCQIL
ncbi:hypothetical protein F3Y22_tig00112230pilonHSYRG00022 [Hibiscus syriacus]|uniref:Uncharacterized protein n=1 Tax=Hibiscus syriacus TaxID=106335 RepID=A0A6A2XIC8_HIBSY|nr:hypothetical protein F3Y22_tig00112230pilonHSYRG00022 [Hibiscus syriacus]